MPNPDLARRFRKAQLLAEARMKESRTHRNVERFFRKAAPNFGISAREISLICAEEDAYEDVIRHIGDGTALARMAYFSGAVPGKASLLKEGLKPSTPVWRAYMEWRSRAGMGAILGFRIGNRFHVLGPRAPYPQTLRCRIAVPCELGPIDLEIVDLDQYLEECNDR